MSFLSHGTKRSNENGCSYFGSFKLLSWHCDRQQVAISRVPVSHVLAQLIMSLIRDPESVYVFRGASLSVSLIGGRAFVAYRVYDETHRFRNRQWVDAHAPSPCLVCEGWRPHSKPPEECGLADGVFVEANSLKRSWKLCNVIKVSECYDEWVGYFLSHFAVDYVFLWLHNVWVHE